MSDNAILAISARAAELRGMGHDVISLAAGEPDLPTPAHITEAAARAAADPAYHHYGTAVGLPQLRELAAHHLAATTHLAWSADDIQIALGTKHALYLALAAVLEPGDDVLVTAPGWPGHHGAIQAAGGHPRQVPVSADNNFLATPETLDAARTPRTRALILASPANPTGAVYPAHLLTDIADWALQHDVWCITDDIYDQFVYDGVPTPLLAAAPQARDHCIAVNGVSKAHAMTGWRIGWLAGPPPVVTYASRLVAQTVTHAPLITQAAAVEALRGAGRPLREARTRYRANRDRLAQALNSVPGIHCPLPDGGLYVFPTVTGLIDANRHRWTAAGDLAAWLLDEALLAVVPGDVFDAPERLRLCFAISETALDLAIERLLHALGPGTQ
ncbi:aminotransferase class I/II-fold pyridoxal phosphate-dependent enzyme [Streptomyces sp. CA-135486]|uniref:aminotransferase class I/II-fold pyridoxal phosphate-dependent enzyme n=1 Tax=Streptomyces sp. CA-135486 TaxID=3240049 RepID=UPI003D8CB856